MRWVVEVSSSDKTDLQKYVVEAESWQRALQNARGLRGETGPMSGFSIELLDEGYRAVDPGSKSRFVVKRAADDAPLTQTPSIIPPPKESKSSVAPKAPKSPSAAPPRPDESKKEMKGKTGRESKKMKAGKKAEEAKAAAAPVSIKPPVPSKPPPPTMIEPESIEAEAAEEVTTEPTAAPMRPPEDSVPMAPLLPVGAFIPGLPSTKLLSSREQDPSDASPLTYREYSFSVAAGTSDEVGANVLRGQLKIVQAHLEKLKQGKLVNLAVFDSEFSGKPPGPPLATLAWKDWKGEPILAFPRRTGAAPSQVKPPTTQSVVPPPVSMPPPAPPSSVSAVPSPPISERSMPRPPGAIAAMLNAAKIGSERKLPVAAPSAPASAPAPAPSAPAPFAPSPDKIPIPIPAGVIPGAANPFAAPVVPPSPPSSANPFAMPAAPQSAPANANPFATGPSSPFASQPPPAPQSAPATANPFSQPPPAAFSQTAPLISPAHLPAQAVAQAPASIPPPATQQSFPPPPAQSVPPPAPVQSVPPPAHSAPPPAYSAPPPMMIPSSPPTGGRQQSNPPPEGVVRTPSGRFVRGRVAGDELITQLFESMHDLHFLRDALDGGQFCLALATEMLPARVAIIHFFDIEKREWIIACTRGKDAGKLLTLRTPESDDLLRAAIRHRRAIVNANASGATGQRYQTLGGARSVIIAPIMQAGRALGAIELINPADGMPFNEDEGNAMTYIAEQYAEYLGSRGIVVNVERIQAAART